MLSEEALLLFVVLGAVALLVLGVLELLAPTRHRHPRRRRAPARDPWRRARSGAARTSQTARPSASAPPAEDPAVEDFDSPFERLLLSEAEGFRIPPMPPPPPRPTERAW